MFRQMELKKNKTKFEVKTLLLRDSVSYEVDRFKKSMVQFHEDLNNLYIKCFGRVGVLIVKIPWRIKLLMVPIGIFLIKMLLPTVVY